MKMEFKDKLVWITGASSGIGRELALRLATEGARLILSSHNAEELRPVAEECRQHTSLCEEVVFDLSCPELVERTGNEVAQQHPDLFGLINNGGISQRALAVDTPVELTRRIMEIDFFSYVVLTKAVLPNMLARGEGFIAATSSISGKFGFPLRSAYAAAKHAIQGYFETLRAELKPHNISVTVLYPGRIRTNISLHAVDGQGREHGQMDPGQLNGLPADICAKRYLNAIRCRRAEQLIGRIELLPVHIKRFFPRLFFRIVTKINPT